ncbi:MAG TPA: hypothetical protein VK209_07460, partial [Candidatus Sulfotelmatobacter sp.]|nr:hypothetical protein [Candidatus Sulfotelmatobacter sp.]
ASYGGNIIGDSYDAVYAINWDTGKISWRFEATTNPYESPYVDPNGTAVSPFFTNVVIADNKVFAYNSEHTVSQPYPRGWKLFAIDATTGKGVWNITGSMSPGAMADGYITASNTYDGHMYVFGKGKTATTVTAPQTSVAKGTKVLIQGTVLDQSPAQRDTPCVSKESMTPQMEYLHMQHPIDGINHNIQMTGVPVALAALAEDGSSVNIGIVTTSAYYGTYEVAWNPPTEGTYTIIASFAGDESYGSSAASTGLIVGPAPTSTDTGQQQQITVPDYTLTIVGMGIAIMIVVAIVGVLIYRKK